jgi:hypothetical protein
MAIATHPARGINLERVLIRVHRQRPLFEIISALSTAGSFPSCLHGREQQRNEHADDGDDDEQFHQSEAAAERSNTHGEGPVHACRRFLQLRSIIDGASFFAKTILRYLSLRSFRMRTSHSSADEL